MTALTRADLYSLEQYAEIRPRFRDQVMAHRKNRRVGIGPNAGLYFEDRLTIQYQIQEMLRVERIFEAEAIQEELDTYNPLIPDGTDWKATFMLEFPDVAQRRAALQELVGIEQRVWVRIGDAGQVFAIANEDLDRSTEEKTSAVHFLRFELSEETINAAIQGSCIVMGIDHPAYSHSITALSGAVRTALLDDLSKPRQ